MYAGRRGRRPLQWRIVLGNSNYNLKYLYIYAIIRKRG